MIAVFVAIFGQFCDIWSARIGKSEDFCDLVKAFADGVVARGADNFEVIVAFHVDDLGMAAADDRGEERKLRLVAAKPVGIDMGF